MAIFTALAVAITGAAIGSFAVTLVATALSVGAQYLISKYTNRKKKRKYTAFKSDKEYGGDVPRQGVFGIGVLPGHFVDYFKWGSGNKYNADVIVLSDGWCDGLEQKIILDGKFINLVAKPIIGNETEHWALAGYENLTSIRFYDGRPNQQADQKLIADTGGNVSTDPDDNVAGAWNGSDVGTNICYLIFEKKYHKSWKSDPQIKWILRGLRCFDFRKDSVNAGGSHELGNAATYEYTKNPAVQRGAYLLGAVNGLISGRTLIGMGKPASHIDVSAHINAANVADQQRTIDV